MRTTILIALAAAACSSKPREAPADGPAGPDAVQRAPDAAPDATAGGADGSPDAAPSGPAITPVGDPIGAPASASIGAAGGSLAADGGRVTLIVPAGALASAQTITITPIANEAPGGVGVAYRMSPDGLVFATPATLVLHATTDDRAAAPLDDLGGATQDASMAWDDQPVTADDGAGTVAIALPHFSDWAWYAHVALRAKQAVFADETAHLALLVESPDPGGKLPYQTPYGGPAVVAWSIASGDGALATGLYTADYTPSIPPAATIVIRADVTPSSGTPATFTARVRVLARHYQLAPDFTVDWMCPGNAWAAHVAEHTTARFALDDGFGASLESADPEAPAGVTAMASCQPSMYTDTPDPGTLGLLITSVTGSYTEAADRIHLGLTGHWADYPNHTEHELNPPKDLPDDPSGSNPLDGLDPYLWFQGVDGEVLDFPEADASRTVDLYFTLTVVSWT